MKVSVIILTYNRAKSLLEAVDSVLNQTFKDLELIIVDNFSTDDTESAVNSLKDERISYFKNENKGFLGINRNFGIEKAQGDYIAFLDDDDLWLMEKLEKQVEMLDSNNELGLVYSDCYIIDDSGTLKEKTYLASRKPVSGSALLGLLEDNTIPILTAVIRKEAIERVGGFDTEFLIAQDYNLWLKIAEYYPIGFINEPLAKYRVHRGAASSKNHIINYKEDLQIRSRWLKKNPDLKKQLGGRYKALKLWPIFLGAIGHIFRNRNLSSIKESVDLMQYILLRKYEKD